MLVTTKEMFAKSREKDYAIVAPDFWDSNSCKTYVETAEELGVPVILSFAQAHSEMLSVEEAYALAKYYGEKASVPVAIHLDHGLDVETVKKAVDLGYTSVMIDASAQPYEVNVARTKEVCDYAHAHGVVVEAELGHVGSGDVITSENKEALHDDKNIRKSIWQNVSSKRRALILLPFRSVPHTAFTKAHRSSTLTDSTNCVLHFLFRLFYTAVPDPAMKTWKDAQRKVSPRSTSLPISQ